MPDTRHHRGPHPQDAALFSSDALAALQAACGDLCWLLSRGYAGASSLALVGDRYRLCARQRVAVSRSSCSDADAAARRARCADAADCRGRELRIDGYNVLTSVEAALAGGVILAARDGAYRDMASMHGSYRKVWETRPALEHIGHTLAAFGIARAEWLLDRPVSNSGRLKTILEEIAAEHGWDWSVELVHDPDAELVVGEGLVATADSAVLDHCAAWLNLARAVIAACVPTAWIVDVSPSSPG